MDNNPIANILQSPELRKRILFVIIALAVYRVAVVVPIPGINAEAIASFFNQHQGGMLGFLDIFSGGALGQFSVLALGIMPYINASIIMGLIKGAHIFPALEKLSKEGEYGRRKENQITRVFGLVLALLQGFGITVAITKMSAPGGIAIVLDPSWTFIITTTLTLAAGTMFIMWLGEQITEKGIGNGISLIIFAGIVDRLPAAVYKLVDLVRNEEIQLLTALIILALVAVIMGLVVWVETAQRQIPVQYAKRMVGNKMYGGQTSYLPLKIDQSGVIAVIFSMAVLSMPLTVAQFMPNAPWAVWIMNWMGRGHATYMLIYVSLIIFFCYFYNSMTFNPKDMAENMKKWGGFIPGIRPGEPTQRYIEWVMNRITLSGALFVAAIAVLPDFLRIKFNVPFYFGGTALLIVVGVALDTVSQIQAHLIQHNYAPLIKGRGIKGRWFNVGE
ncbi:MAG: preprotein translocase subunit SecY [Elusimicrobiota bacterium]|jgi:preprotein translocase subunit SecY|nr:preprotein translocase subunit SecY [Elusimicrobiota bacterium]